MPRRAKRETLPLVGTASQRLELARAEFLEAFRSFGKIEGAEPRWQPSSPWGQLIAQVWPEWERGARVPVFCFSRRFPEIHALFQNAPIKTVPRIGVRRLAAWLDRWSLRVPWAAQMLAETLDSWQRFPEIRCRWILLPSGTADYIPDFQQVFNIEITWDPYSEPREKAESRAKYKLLAAVKKLPKLFDSWEKQVPQKDSLTLTKPLLVTIEDLGYYWASRCTVLQLTERISRRHGRALEEAAVIRSVQKLCQRLGLPRRKS